MSQRVLDHYPYPTLDPGRILDLGSVHSRRPGVTLRSSVSLLGPL